LHWYNCCPQHTWPLNANLKAYVAWYLFACLAGWDGESGVSEDENFEREIKFNIDINIISGEAKLDFYLSQGSLIKIELIDISGRKLLTILERKYSKGNHSYTWQTDGIKSGIYLIIFTGPSGKISKKTVVLGN
jgi:hypothetical protein